MTVPTPSTAIAILLLLAVALSAVASIARLAQFESEAGERWLFAMFCFMGAFAALVFAADAGWVR